MHGKQISLSTVFENRIPSIETKCWLFGSTKKLVKFVHPTNAESPIDVTLDGIAMNCKFIHIENAESPIDVTLGGIMIDCKFLQWENADLPIEVTFGGIVYVVNGWLLGKQINLPTCFSKRIPSIEIKCWLLSSTIIIFNAEHCPKAKLPIDATFDGIVIDSKLEQKKNASSSIDFTLVDIVIDVKCSQP